MFCMSCRIQKCSGIYIILFEGTNALYVLQNTRVQWREINIMINLTLYRGNNPSEQWWAGG